ARRLASRQLLKRLSSTLFEVGHALSVFGCLAIFAGLRGLLDVLLQLLEALAVLLAGLRDLAGYQSGNSHSVGAGLAVIAQSGQLLIGNMTRELLQPHGILDGPGAKVGVKPE